MKAKQIFKTLLSTSLVVAFATLSACTSGEKQSGSHDEHAEATIDEPKSEAGNPQFKDEKVKVAYEHYIHIKNALVKADAKEAQKGAAQLQTALTAAGNKAGADLAGKIASASKLDVQRNELDALTSEVEKTIKASKLASGKVFKQFCPMAKNGDGAYWLASESDIKNPYYGDEMLECGEVKEEIK